MKKSLVLSSDVVLGVVTTWMAFAFRFDSLIEISWPVLVASAISVLLLVPIFINSGLYRAIFRYSGWFATLSLVRAMSVYMILYATMVLAIGVPGVPRSIGLIQPVLLFVAIGAMRLLVKALLNDVVYKTQRVSETKLTLIYGAGSAGRQIASGLRQTGDIKPIGFVDDDSRLWGSLINGLPVHAPHELPMLVQSARGVDNVLVAIPSASRQRQKEVLSTLSELPVHVRMLPGLSHLANGIVKVEDVRSVDIQDILGRDQVAPDAELLHQNITSKVVMVTGAGGSIGSELCRQIIAQDPLAILLFEQSEYALYKVDRELTQLGSAVKIVPVLGSVLDSQVLERLIESMGVQTIYHAAAYKHVPMIEANPAAGVWNNVFGTLRTLDVACRFGVEAFVLISTDKAVRPSNVMGCSKRIAELVLQAQNMRGCYSTKLTMVRFGNVLGSSGSVVPLFHEQIKNGGPVTVTDPEVIRYFMTITEAAQLVIQAGAIGEGGDVMVLDMGKPIKIVDLARRMIHLSGLSYKDEMNPDGDIEIQYTGLRPGEKLYEELLIGDNALPTSHPLIMRAVEHALSWRDLQPMLVALERATKVDDREAISALLREIVPEYNPQLKGIGMHLSAKS